MDTRYGAEWGGQVTFVSNPPPYPCLAHLFFKPQVPFSQHHGQPVFFPSELLSSPCCPFILRAQAAAAGGAARSCPRRAILGRGGGLWAQGARQSSCRLFLGRGRATPSCITAAALENLVMAVHTARKDAQGQFQK